VEDEHVLVDLSLHMFTFGLALKPARMTGDDWPLSIASS